MLRKKSNILDVKNKKFFKQGLENLLSIETKNILADVIIEKPREEEKIDHNKQPNKNNKSNKSIQEHEGSLVKGIFQESFTKKDMEENRRHGYEEGYAKGYRDAKDISLEVQQNIEKKIPLFLEEITKLIAKAEDKELLFFKESTDIILSISKKITEKVIEDNKHEIIFNVVKNCITLLKSESYLEIIVHNDLVEELSKSIDNISSQVGFKGKIIVKGSLDIDLGSCQVDWKEGSMKRDTNIIKEEISKLLSNTKL